MKLSSITAVATAVYAIFFGAVLGCRDNSRNPTRQSAASVRHAFSIGIDARAKVMDAHLKMARWPATNQEAGLPLPETYTTPTISALTVSTGGVITIRFKPEGTMRLLPDDRYTPIGMRWRCVTSGVEKVTAIVPCKPER